MSESTMTMPSLGETMEHGIVAAWLVQEGQPFSRGDPIIEFETDKTAVEYPALGDGVLLQQLVREGDQVMIGAPIAKVDIGDGPDWLASDRAVGKEAPADVDLGAVAVDTQTSQTASETTILSQDVSRQEGSGQAESRQAKAGHHRSRQAEHRQDAVGRTKSGQAIPRQDLSRRATPVARHLARQRGVALSSIAGSGRRERIEQRDVEAAIYARNSLRELPVDLSQGESVLSTIGKIACHVQGEDTGTPCLLLHGFAADHSAWSLLSRALAKAGCCAIATDLPGHGQTLLDASHVDDLSAGLDQVLEQVAGHQGCHIIAHSLGVVPAVKLALSQVNMKTPSTIASLTLIAPAGLGLFIDTQFVTGMAEPSSRAELTHLLRRLSDRPIALSSAAIDTLHESLKQGRLSHLAESFVSAAGQKVDIHDAIASLASTMPVRIIMGHADRIIDWSDALTVSPKVSVHHLPAVGHVPHWDEPRAVAEIILSAIR